MIMWDKGHSYNVTRDGLYVCYYNTPPRLVKVYAWLITSDETATVSVGPHLVPSPTCVRPL